jgi:hypothetical protein
MIILIIWSVIFLILFLEYKTNPTIMESKFIDKDTEKRKYELWNDFLQSSKKNVFYSYQRIDLVIVAFSTGSLATIISSIQIIKSIPSECFKCLCVFALMLFAATIIINILSQVYSAKHNSEECAESINRLSIMNGSKIDEYENDNKYLNITEKLNLTSVLTFSLGIFFSVLATAIILLN